MACNSAWWLVLKSCSVNSSCSAIPLQRALLPSPPRRWASAFRHCITQRKGRKEATNQPHLPQETHPELIQLCDFHRISTLWLPNRYMKGRYSQRLHFSFGCGTSRWFYYGIFDQMPCHRQLWLYKAVLIDLQLNITADKATLKSSPELSLPLHSELYNQAKP